MVASALPAIAPRVPWKCPFCLAQPPAELQALSAHTQLTCVCRDRQGLVLGPEPAGARRVEQTGKTQSPENKLLQANLLGSLARLTDREEEPCDGL